MKALIQVFSPGILFSSLLIMSHVALAEPRVLNAEEVTSTFSGKTAWGEHAFKQKKSMVYFSPDGSYKGKRLDKGESNDGKWSVSKDGKLCMKKKKERCRKIVDEDGVIKKYKKSKHVWTYTKFEDGNRVD